MSRMSQGKQKSFSKEDFLQHKTNMNNKNTNEIHMLFSFLLYDLKSFRNCSSTFACWKTEESILAELLISCKNTLGGDHKPMALLTKKWLLCFEAIHLFRPHKN